MRLRTKLFGVLAPLTLLVPAVAFAGPPGASTQAHAPTAASKPASATKFTSAERTLESVTAGTGLNRIAMKASAMKDALKDKKVVVVQEKSTGKAFEVIKVTHKILGYKTHNQWVTVTPGPANLAPPEKLSFKEFKARFNSPGVSKGTRGSFPGGS
jgi:hypothetical protein